MPYKDKNNPRNRWRQHKWNAKKAGTAFLLSFDEWLEIWMRSKRWKQRGQRRDQYVMARLGDKGPYAVGNVKIIQHKKNDSDGARHRPPSSEAIRLRLIRFNKSLSKRKLMKRFVKNRKRDSKGRFILMTDGDDNELEVGNEGRRKVDHERSAFRHRRRGQAVRL